MLGSNAVDLFVDLLLLCFPHRDIIFGNETECEAFGEAAGYGMCVARAVRARTFNSSRAPPLQIPRTARKLH